MITALFSPTSLGNLALKSRIVMAPLTRSRASPAGVPAAFAADYYSQRATAGLVIAEMTQISTEGMGYARTPGIHEPAHVEGWRAITSAVHAVGGTMVLQLGHVGRIASRLNRPAQADVVSASAIQAPGQMWTDQKQMVDHDTPRALETDEIARVAKEFASAAEHAIAAGFDGVEFHSANGYLPHQFLSSNVNQRTDRYGGSIDNRIRMPLEVLTAITSRVGPDKVGIRISPGHTFNGIEESDCDALYAAYIAELDRMGLAYLHVMRPFANKTASDPVPMARRHFKGPMIACGGYTGATAAELITARGADAVAFGRDYIANPDLSERLRRGLPLATADEKTFYTPGPVGYSDYPAVT